MWPRCLDLKVSACSSQKVLALSTPCCRTWQGAFTSPGPSAAEAGAGLRPPGSRGCAKERRFTDMTADRTKEGGAGGTSRVVGRVQDFRGPGRQLLLAAASCQRQDNRHIGPDLPKQVLVRAGGELAPRKREPDHGLRLHRRVAPGSGTWIRILAVFHASSRRDRGSLQIICEPADLGFFGPGQRPGGCRTGCRQRFRGGVSDRPAQVFQQRPDRRGRDAFHQGPVKRGTGPAPWRPVRAGHAELHVVVVVARGSGRRPARGTARPHARLPPTAAGRSWWRHGGPGQGTARGPAWRHRASHRTGRLARPRSCPLRTRSPRHYAAHTMEIAQTRVTPAAGATRGGMGEMSRSGT